METAIQIVWWIGLIGALIATLVVLKQVFLLLRVLRDIHRLAEYTREAARGLAAHASRGVRLQDAASPARALHEASAALAAAAASVHRRLDALSKP